jgi:hypothetical protein
MDRNGELKLPRGTISWKDLGGTHGEVEFNQQDGIAILHLFRDEGVKPVFVVEYYNSESGFDQYHTREELLKWLRWVGTDLFEHDLLGDDTFQKTVLKAVDFCCATESLWNEGKYDEYFQEQRYFSSSGTPTVNLEALPECLRHLVEPNKQ